MNINKEVQKRFVKSQGINKTIVRVVGQLHKRAVRNYKNYGVNLVEKHLIFIFLRSGYGLSKMAWADVEKLFEKASPEGTHVSVSRGLMDLTLLPGFSVFLQLEIE